MLLPVHSRIVVSTGYYVIDPVICQATDPERCNQWMSASTPGFTRRQLRGGRSGQPDGWTGC
jgi:hypothetical protein